MTMDKSKQWQTAIREARQYVNNYDKARWIICDIAIRVCDPFKSSHKQRHSLYSFRNFASEIEIEYKTLVDWIRIKRLVYDKLPKNIQSDAHTYLFAHFKETVDMVHAESTPNQVYNVFKSVCKADPNIRKFKKYIGHLRSVLYNAQRPLLLANVPDETIIEIQSYAKLILSFMTKELDLREQFGTDRQSMDKARLNIKKEIDKRLFS